MFIVKLADQPEYTQLALLRYNHFGARKYTKFYKKQHRLMKKNEANDRQREKYHKEPLYRENRIESAKQYNIRKRLGELCDN